MKKWLIKKADDSVVIISSKSSPENFMQETDVLIGEAPQDTPDREFRDCWKEDSGELKVDLPKAREKRLAEIRAERDARLKATDEAWVEGMSKGEDVSAIEALKQTLRDIPATAETELSSKLATTTIKAYDPDWPE